MRIISFCAEDIEAAAKQGFYEWALDQDADFICVQDLRHQEYDLKGDVYFPRDYNAYFFDAVDKNSNGVAIYTRQLPKAIMTGLGFVDFDIEGRYIQADFERFSVGSFLAPFAPPGDAAALQRKLAFYEQLLAHLNKVRNKRREFIICGNWNIAHTEYDVENAANQENVAGFLSEERVLLDQLFTELGYVDAFRNVCSDDDEYTWWPDGNQDANGWRVDLQVVSEGLQHTIEYGSIYKNQQFSNHAPLIMDYETDF
ncbi:MAG: exodeoxyribonuclease III [Pseudomonadales bacterium]